MHHERTSGGGGQSAAPLLFAIASLLMNVAFVVAGISALYLLYGLIFGLGEFQTWERGRQVQMLNNLLLAGRGLTLGMAIGSLCAALVFWYEETTGYLLLVGAAVFGIGFPLVAPLLGLSLQGNRGALIALTAFPVSMLVPGAVGAVLVVKDLIARIMMAIERRVVDTSQMQFGQGARVEGKPLRTSVLAKCWEGPYCREFVRVHCPIYVKRATCWKERRGCYCEEDIVINASSKTKGVQLEMAPESRFNFANPSTPGAAGGSVRKAALTPAQKAERCRNCVIYNEHQREKYRLLLPITLLGIAVLCAVLAFSLRPYVGGAMVAVERLMNNFAFTGDPNPAVKVTLPNETAQWAVMIALSVMVISKSVQVLEWAVFEKKV